MIAPTVIRCSALTGYPDCERRGAARLFWKEITAAGFKLRFTPRSIGALVGSAVHKGAAVELAEKAKDGKLPPVSVPIDAAGGELKEQLLGGDVVFEDGPRGVTRDRDDALRQTVSMVRSYHTGVASSSNRSASSTGLRPRSRQASCCPANRISSAASRNRSATLRPAHGRRRRPRRRSAAIRY